MLLTLRIDERPGYFTARVLRGTTEVDTFAANTLGAALYEAALRCYDSEGLEGFELSLDGSLMDTTTALELRHEGDAVAQRLVCQRKQRPRVAVAA